MMKRKSQRPGLEPLESRLAPIGFIESPAPVPIRLFLQGAASGIAIEPSGLKAKNGIVHVAAAGEVNPLGWTSLNGTLRVSGGLEHGTLTVKSRNSNLVLDVAGPAASPNAPAHLAFRIVDGKGPAPSHTTFS